jgi:hypothetical protein
MQGARSTLIMFVVFLGLASYVYFVELERSPASDIPPNEQLFDVEAESIGAITISADGNEISLSKTDDGEWKLTAPVQARADTTEVSSMTTRLASIEINRVVSDELVDLEPFGLSAPTIQVFFRTVDSSIEDRLLIGKMTPTGTDRYAKLETSDRIIMVASGLDSTFRKTSFDLRDKTILDIEALDVDRLEVEVNGSTIAFDKIDGDWRMVDPWDVRADYSTVQGLVGRLSNGQMRSVVSENPLNDGDEDVDPLDAYGLSDPAATATVRTGSATATLRIGNQAPDGTRYAKDASRSLLFTIAESISVDIEREAREYRDKNLFAFRPFNARRIEVARPDIITAFEKAETENVDDDEAKDTWRRIEPSTANIERTDMDDLLAKLSNLRAESFIDARSKLGLDDSNVLATVTVQYEDLVAADDATLLEERVSLWRTDDNTYAVHGDESGAAIVNTQSVDEALEIAQAQEP